MSCFEFTLGGFAVRCGVFLHVSYALASKVDTTNSKPSPVQNKTRNPTSYPPQAKSNIRFSYLTCIPHTPHTTTERRPNTAGAVL